jgi:hypothetical protein
VRSRVWTRITMSDLTISAYFASWVRTYETLLFITSMCLKLPHYHLICQLLFIKIALVFFFLKEKQYAFIYRECGRQYLQESGRHSEDERKEVMFAGSKWRLTPRSRTWLMILNRWFKMERAARWLIGSPSI